MFKVPSLRNIALTAPYFHDGKVKDLGKAVAIMADIQLNKLLTDSEKIKLLEQEKKVINKYFIIFPVHILC